MTKLADTSYLNLFSVLPLSIPLVINNVGLHGLLQGHLYLSLNWGIFLVMFKILRAVGYCQDK